MGPYEDEVLCDVVPMDACHLLLGRPWQYDRDVVHQGRSNVLSLVKDEKKIILKPMSPASIRATHSSQGKKAGQTLFTSEREAEQAHHDAGFGYTLMARARAEEQQESNAKADLGMLLEENKGVFPINVSSGLLHVQGSKLIPGALLLEATHRSDPRETKELQLQVVWNGSLSLTLKCLIVKIFQAHLRFAFQSKSKLSHCIMGFDPGGGCFGSKG
ncbi:uncharacterized protein LOC141631853 [Silene latifolia]|uniref:uncharacterized protein LOC141631853 n=1 Tax=Silene latifolia TaxID=37657 RepID=UPI003D76EF44